MIIAAIAVCSALTTPIKDCDQRTAVEVLFPAACAYDRVRCSHGDAFVYEDRSVPYVCFKESQAWALSPSNLQHRIERDEYIVVYCGRTSNILNKFGTI